MKVSQTELFGSVAILLYIVFFSHSPPAVLRSALSNTIVAALVVAVIGYVTLYQSRTIGVLLVIAFVLTMTKVTEHMEASTTPESTSTPPQIPIPPSPTNTPVPPAPPASTSDNTTPATATPTLPPVNSTPPPEITAAATTSPAPAKEPPPPPISTPPAPTAPATPPTATAPPAPVMSCNIESFAPF